MNTSPKLRTEYIGIRVTPFEKNLIKGLAASKGVSVTTFILFLVSIYLSVHREVSK